MKKLLALLGVALLAGCQMPGADDNEAMEEENMMPPMEEALTPPAEEPVVEPAAEEPAMEEEEATPEEAAAEANIEVETTNDLGEAI